MCNNLILQTFGWVCILALSVAQFTSTTSRPAAGSTNCDAYLDLNKTVQNSKAHNLAECFASAIQDWINNKAACPSKCVYGKLKIFTSFGKVNVTNVKDHFTQTSNATSQLVERMVALFQQCEKQAESAIKTLQKNGAVIGSCQFTNLFDTCLNAPENPRICLEVTIGKANS